MTIYTHVYICLFIEIDHRDYYCGGLKMGGNRHRELCKISESRDKTNIVKTRQTENFVIEYSASLPHMEPNIQKKWDFGEFSKPFPMRKHQGRLAIERDL